MGEVGGGIPIGGGDDEPAKIDVRTRRRGGAGRSDEVTPDNLAQGLMNRRTRRQSSKKATKNSNSSVKTMCAQGAH